MNTLITALSWLICLVFIVGSYFFWDHVASILDSGEYLLIWLILVCSLIWFGRRNKDGIFRLFKDIHQSNLDDIKQQQLKEPVDEVVMKEQIFKFSSSSQYILVYLTDCNLLCYISCCSRKYRYSRLANCIKHYCSATYSGVFCW